VGHHEARGKTAGEHGEESGAESDCAGELALARKTSASAVRDIGVMALFHNVVLVSAGGIACLRALLQKKEESVTGRV
jgi:hypothetical protein